MTKNPTLEFIPIEAIEPNPFQPRRHFAPAEMDELAASIREHGVLEPILVRPISGKKHAGVLYQLVAGERRWRAATAAGLSTIPATVRKLNDIQSLQIALIENIQRENPDDWSTASGIKNLMALSARDGQQLSMREVARMLDKSVGFVNNHLNLFKLRPTLQAVAQRHNNVKSSLFEIQKVKDSEAEAELIEAIDAGAAFQEIKGRVEQILTDAQWQKDSQRAPDPETRAAVSKQERRAQEAAKEVTRALQAAERELMNASAYLGDVPRKTFRDDVEPRLLRLRERLESMSG